MDENEDLLDQLIALASEEQAAPAAARENQEGGAFDAALKSLDKLTEEVAKTTNKKKTSAALPSAKGSGSTSVIHSGDTDSSDDEDNRSGGKHDAWSREIKHLLSASARTKGSGESPCVLSSSTTWNRKALPKPIGGVAKATTPINKATQPSEYVFGLRVVNPLVSTKLLEERMEGRQLVTFSMLKAFAKNMQTEKSDWVIAGAIVYKTATKTSQNGKKFCSLTLSDLKVDLKTVKVFLFGNAHKELWKTSVGTVVGVLNADIMESRPGTDKDEACLSVYNPQKVMILGQSKDLGTCKSVCKSGEKCGNFVNLAVCDYCVYHVKQEYQKATRRSDLQSGFTGRGLTALKNKVLAKTEFIYGGKLYTAQKPAKRNERLETQDTNRLKSLMSKGPVVKKGASNGKGMSLAQRRLCVATKNFEEQRQKDFERLRLLGSDSLDLFKKQEGQFTGSVSKDVTLEQSKSLALDVIAKLKKKNSQQETASNNVVISTNSTLCTTSSPAIKSLPFLSAPKTTDNNLIIDLNSSSITLKKREALARARALSYVSNKGCIAKADPNNTRGTDMGKKRALEALNNMDPKKAKLEEAAVINNDPKLRKIRENEFFSDRFKKMMEATSQHSDLVKQRDDEEQDKYFDRLEAKERMEDKMTSTYKVECKAVRCLECKYTSFSAAEKCKTEKHRLKVYDALKRFFKCSNCGNRTACLTVVPVDECTNCGCRKWEKTSMMKEKVVTVGPRLSIRGGEQLSVNAEITDANLDLLVPDS